MKKRKISLIIIALAMALCMALCIILPACGGSDDDGGTENPPATELDPEDDGDGDGDEDGDGTEEHTTHSYTILKSDDTGHWYECECGEKDATSFASHSSTKDDGTKAYDSDDTQHWEVCAVCGYDITGEENREDHTTSEVSYQQNATYHWHVCDVCGGEMDKAKHSYTDGVCICGAEEVELTNTKVYMVGDSTMCGFNDQYYLPRYGYGTQLGNYLDSKAEVVNYALSGRSSLTFLYENNYTKLMSEIGAGDYLIIGFGHNDEKHADPGTTETFTDPSLGLGESTNEVVGFQDNLYNNYIEPAEAKGATAILCTPIVRYSSSSSYTGSKVHVTDDGDYPAAIKNLGETKGIDVIDLTAITKAVYAADNDAAQWYHCHTAAEATTDTTAPMARQIETTASTTEDPQYQLVVPSGRDDTHLNMYGAKMVAYEFAEALADTDNGLARYVLSDAAGPSIENDMEAAYNPDYRYLKYTAFDPENDNTTFTGLPEGWYGTYMGDMASNTTISYTESGTGDGLGTFTIGSTKSTTGKIASTGDQLATAFMQLSRYQNFEITATATVTADLNHGDSQTAFGIMLRDDIRINDTSTTIISDYVTAGLLGGGTTKDSDDNITAYSNSYANFYRQDGSLNKGNQLSIVFDTETNNVFELKMVRSNETVACTVTLQDGTTIEGSAPPDVGFYGVDYDNVYLCLFATRGVTCVFTNVVYTATGTSEGA